MLAKMKQQAMRKGMVLGIDQSIGYGFIQDENEQQIAFPLENLDKNFKIGDTIEFEIEHTKRGLTAINIKLLVFA
jgi:cold shock CspA family protein